MPVLKGEASLDTNDVFIQWNGLGDRNLGSPRINLLATMPWRSIVTCEGRNGAGQQRWKLNLCAGDQSELFDLGSDPFEQVNLFTDPSQKDRIREMSAKIRLWQYETGDGASIPNV